MPQTGRQLRCFGFCQAPRASEYLLIGWRVLRESFLDTTSRHYRWGNSEYNFVARNVYHTLIGKSHVQLKNERRSVSITYNLKRVSETWPFGTFSGGLWAQRRSRSERQSGLNKTFDALAEDVSNVPYSELLAPLRARVDPSTASKEAWNTEKQRHRISLCSGTTPLGSLWYTPTK